MSKKRKNEESETENTKAKTEAESVTAEEPAPATAPEKEEHPVVFEEALEAILFAAGHPVTYTTLARVLGMTPGQVKDRVFEYACKYNDSPLIRGVTLLTYPDSAQLATKQYYLPEIRDALGLKRTGTLSTSSMEALAIVAYNQPVTRFFVDTLRRADSSYAMNNLIDRGLIECKGRLDVPGRPMIFGTTNDFLRCFGLRSIKDLPKTTEEIDAMFGKAKQMEMEIESTGTSDNADPDELSTAPENKEDLLAEGAPAEVAAAEPKQEKIFNPDDEAGAEDGLENEI